MNYKIFFVSLFMLCISIPFSSPSLAATVSGTVTMTCDTYTTGKIDLVLESKNFSYITSVSIDAPGPYTLTVDDTHLGETVFIVGWWIKDEINWFSVGDCVGFGPSFQLAAENTVDVDINHKCTASVSGDVICDAHTTGYIIPMILGPSGQPSYFGLILSEPGPYTCYVLDLPFGTPVWVFGYWNIDGLGYMTYGDYAGWYTGNPLMLSEVNTGIDLVISHEIVASVSGTVTCSPFTSGYTCFLAYDGPDPNTANLKSSGQTFPISPSAYSMNIYDTELGSPIWIFGYWDKDGSGTISPGEYMGAYPGNPITLQQTNSDINFDMCACIDSDGDTICDGNDNCSDSHLESTIVIGDCDTGVANQYLEDGCTMSDQIAQCEENAKNHGQFVKCVNRLTNNWKKSGLITKKEKGAITRCAAKADIP